MRLSSALRPFWQICYGTSFAWRPTMRALWTTPALMLHPAKVSQLFMAHLWTAFADPIDDGSRELKEDLITTNAYGVVLDLGAGYGHTAKYLDRCRVTKYVALEPNAMMHQGIRTAAEAAGFTEADGTLLVLGCGAEDVSHIVDALGQPDGQSVDTIVSILTLCSIPRPEETLTALVREVLKPGGTFVFNEHVLNYLEDVAWWQRFWTPLWKIFLDGCCLDRPTHLWIERMGVWAEGGVRVGSEEEVGEDGDAIFFHKVGRFVKQ
ncbi:hypothetical protein FIBSPDRAFT_786565 [Athelia psychrophila]|uniref:S-adenosyl-L-methionine-dependent methyltransferase n=1 Tax=Athelia psychrophila TaxID=1759441 RepID=A0A166LF06_9AGAM|nr:hypothetical protein FIBSPDRAFT_786565 [Fibularhizoctonia sp. CBS 109695]